MTQDASRNNFLQTHKQPEVVRDQVAESVHSAAAGSGSLGGVRIKQEKFSGLAVAASSGRVVLT